MRHLRWTTIALAGGLLAGLAIPASAQQVAGERSWTRPQPAATWKRAGHPAKSIARQTYLEVEVQRLLRLQRANTMRVMKPTQVGIARHGLRESAQPSLPPLVWLDADTGGAVARIEVRSPDALALRVGLQFDRLDDRAELRFAGSDEPGRVVAVMRGEEIRRLPGADGLFWTPSTDGEAQIIEIFRPVGVPAAAVRVDAPRLSHLVANSRNDFKLIEKVGESGTCNVDTSCRVSELGPHFVDAKNAVAHMQFVIGGGTYICSGTLLADTVPSSQTPYFYSANHCFSTSEGAPDSAQVQAVANTLNTFWNYEATSCRSGIAASSTQLTGGAAYLYSDERSDAMLLRLNQTAPAGAFFAGWTAAPLAPSGAILGIHHPRGDVKKVSSGQHVSTSPDMHSVAWTSGTTEGGSSGSALFTLGARGYELRGGLYGGEASCANTGSVSNTANRDHYSRFDVVFPRIQQYLASEPVLRNGAEPLLPPRPAPAGAVPVPGGAGSMQAGPARPATAVDARERRRRAGTMPRRRER